MIQIEGIISKLQPSLTRTETEALRRDSLSNFFVSLIETYEKKAARYLESCKGLVKQTLQKENTDPQDLLDSAAVERITQYAYTILLQQNRASLLPSLTHLLQHQQRRELLVSLGFAASYKTADKTYRLEHLTAKVFQAYMARHRLFLELGAEDLRAVLRELGPENASTFPSYLVEAFVVQQMCGRAIEAAAQDIPAEQRSRVIAEIFQQHRDPIFFSLRALLSFLGNVLKGCEIEADARERFFAHLNNTPRLEAFVQMISGGYVQASSENTHAEIQKIHSALCESSIAPICLPSLRLLGIKVTLPAPNFEEAKTALSNQMREVNQRKDALRAQVDSEIGGKIGEAHRKIKEAIDNAPREWVIGVPLQAGPTIRF